MLELKEGDFIKVTFEDHGQDFAYWILRYVGGKLWKVEDSYPCQASIWTQYYVLMAPSDMVPGKKLKYSLSPQDNVYTLKYPITEVDREPAE